MKAQLSAAYPMSTYPTVAVTPDGSLAVAAKKSLVRYARSGEWTFRRVSAWPDRPGAPWAYPNTGALRVAGWRSCLPGGQGWSAGSAGMLRHACPPPALER